MKTIEEFLESDFNKKYEDTYYSDSILKSVFNISLKKHRIRLSSYNAIYEKNIELMQDYIKYSQQAKITDKNTKWLMLSSFYIDPDGKAIRNVDGIECSADGLLSLLRIYRANGMTTKLIDEYREYRKKPIFYFPKESNGINVSRARLFGDRIDHTIYDIKRMCEGKDACRMNLAYSQPNTEKWLKYFKFDFGKIINWWDVDGIFVNEDNEVFDLEKGDGTIIRDYSTSYPWEWSASYYNNIKSKISQFFKNKNEKI